MYTRSRQSQNYGPGGGTPQRGNQYQGQNFNQGTYQAANQNQNALKSGIPFKQQPQGQQRNIPQQNPKPVMQQQVQPQQQQQQQQQIPQQQQQIPQQQQQIPQQQQQQQNQPQPQQLVNPQQQTVQNPQQQSTPQMQRLKPILKSSTPVVNQGPTTPQAQQPNPQMNLQNLQQSPLQQQSAQISQQNQLADQNAPQNMEVSENGVEGTPNENNNGNQEGAPRWKRRFSGKPNKKLKRLRMNQRLRKSIQPKNAVMALYEMKCGVQFTYPETQTILPNCPFIVHAHVDGKTFIGEGITKTLARQNAAENALKSQLLEKMSAAALKAATEAGGENQSNEEMKDSNDPQSEVKQEGDTTIDESEMIPWGPLASFALYKLFSEWQNEGTIVPIPKPPGSILPMNKPKKEGVPKAASQKEVPANAMYVHPVMLLNQMRPGLTFVETCRQGNPPNMMFTIAVEVDNKEYTGTARNKKDAKKLAARAALRGCFGVNYPEDSNDAVMVEG